MRKYRPHVVVVLLLLLLTGCATVPLTPTARYYETLVTFNDFVESYDWHYAIVDAEKQAVLKKYVDPVIEKANTALDWWGKNTNSMQRMEAYNTVFRELQLLMLRYGVGGDV